MERTRPQPLQQLVMALLVAAMVLSFTAALDDFWHMGDSLLRVALLSLVATVIAWLHWRYPAAVRWGLTGLPVAVVVGLYFKSTRAVLSALGYMLAQFVSRMLRDPFTTMEPILAYIFLVLITLLVAGLIAWEALQWGDGFWSLAIGVIVFAQQWLMYYDNTTWFTLFCTFGVLLWAAARSARRDLRWEWEGRRVVSRSALGAAAGLCVAIALFSIVAPSGFEPIDLGNYASRLQAKYPTLQRLRGAGTAEGDDTKTGFSTALDNLGGPVTPSLTPVLEIDTDQGVDSTLYLRGDVRTAYTGKTWQKPDVAPATVDPRTQMPTVYPASMPTTALDAKVTSDLPSTMNVFTVLETKRIEGMNDTVLLSPEGIVTPHRALSKGQSYTLGLALPQVAIPPLRSVSFGDLSALRSQPGFAPYFQVPDGVPSRVHDLAVQVTKGAQTPYEAAAALEQYLRQTFPYTLDAPNVPANRDFVDFFLFDGKTGYCTYYSTALAVMLRTLGIPARWVAGFAVSPPANDAAIPQAISIKNFTARDADAHAWVEVYFPQTGWVTFDPTPRFGTPFRSPTLPGTEVEPSPPPTTPPAPPAPPKGPTLWERLTNLGWGVWTAAGIVALLALAFLAAALRLRRLSALPLQDGTMAVQAVWGNLERLMAQMGTERHPAETVREFAHRLGHEWPQLAPALAGMPERYAAARYGAAAPELGAEAVGGVRSLWQAAERACRDRYGLLGFYWRRLRPRYFFPWQRGRRSRPRREQRRRSMA